MGVHYTILSLKLVFLIAVFICSVEGYGDGDNQKFDSSVEDATENHFTYSDMSHG